MEKNEKVNHGNPDSNSSKSHNKEPGMINAGGKQFTGVSADGTTSSEGLPTMETSLPNERNNKNSETAEKS